MGLFWFTAPIAWLYAIPVERFLDDLNAARANVTLLALVSLWRILLMIRITQVISRASIWLSTLWVMTAAFAEAFVVTFFGGVFARAIIAGMGGLRNSPAEEVVMSVLNLAFSVSFFGFPIAFISTLVFRYSRTKLATSDFPQRIKDAMPDRFLIFAATAWIALAIPSQLQGIRSATLDRLVRDEQYVAAVEYLSIHIPSDFWPSRPLPPRVYEWQVFKEVPAIISAVRPEHPDWIHEHMVRRMDDFARHFEPASRSTRADTETIGYRIERFTQTFGQEEFATVITNLVKWPAGREWIRTNQTLIPALYAYSAKEAAMDDNSAMLTNVLGRVRQAAPPSME